MLNSSVANLVLMQIWQVAVAVVIAWSLGRLFARHRPYFAFGIWLIVAVKCITPPIWGHPLSISNQFPMPWLLPETRPATVEFSAGGKGDQTTSDDATIDWQVSSADLTTYQADLDSVATAYNVSLPAALPEPLPFWLTAALLLTLMGSMVSFGIVTLRFRRCLAAIHKHRVDDFDSGIHAILQPIADQLRLRRLPRVIVSDVLFGPAVLGVIRPTIMLPCCLFEGRADSDSSRSHIGLILAHELMHIRRGDLWVGALQAFIQCLWWFHPCVWLMNRALSREAERCCDESVIAEVGCSPADYARSLLTVIESKQSLQAVPVFPGMKPVEITSQRMERIMSLKKNHIKPRLSYLAATALLLFASVSLPGAASQGERKNHSASDPQVAAHLDSHETSPSIQPDNAVAQTTRHVPAVAPAVFGEIIWFQANARGFRRLIGDESSGGIALIKSPKAIEELRRLEGSGQGTRGRHITFRMVTDTAPGTNWASYSSPSDAPTSFSLECHCRPAGGEVGVCKLRIGSQRYHAAGGMQGMSLCVDATQALKEMSAATGGNEDLELPAHHFMIAVVSVRVQSAQTVCVLGEVKSPGEFAVEMQSPMTVTSAIDLAGGLTANATGQITVERPLGDSGRETDVIHVSHDAAVAHDKSDIVLGPGDIVSVLPPDVDVISVEMAERGGVNSVQQFGAVSSPPGTFGIEQDDTIRSDAGVTGTILNPPVAATELPETSPRYTLEVYALRDIVDLEMANRTSGETRAGEFSELVRSIREDVATESWDSNGGDGRIVGNADTETAVVRQTREIHEQLVTFLTEMRERLAKERLVTRVYSVADLIVPVNPVARPGSQAHSMSSPLNEGDPAFAPLIQLLKASVAPESWDDRRRIRRSVNTLSLIIRQTDEAHEEVSEILRQLRREMDWQVILDCVAIHFESGDQVTWLKNHVSFQGDDSIRPWCLFPAGRFEQLQADMQQAGASVLFHPIVTVFNRQQASISGGDALKVDIQVQPNLYANNSLIRLQHSATVGAAAKQAPPEMSSLLKDGQTILVDITPTQPSTAIVSGTKAEGGAARPSADQERVLLAVTARVLLMEEEEAVALPHSDQF